MDDALYTLLDYNFDNDNFDNNNFPISMTRQFRQFHSTTSAPHPFGNCAVVKYNSRRIRSVRAYATVIVNGLISDGTAGANSHTVPTTPNISDTSFL